MMQASDVVAVCAALSNAGIRAWVAGGWAVDAVAGQQTREHQDLDLAVDARHLQPVLDLLGGFGFAPTVRWGMSRVELTAPDGRTVDLHPVTFAEDGTGIQDGLDGQTFFYAAEGFTVGLIGGHSVPCLSIEQQMRFRHGYELRAVDHHDLALLDRAKAETPGTA